MYEYFCCLTGTTILLDGIKMQQVFFRFTEDVRHRWQTQGLRAEPGPPPCFIRPDTLFLPGGSAELLLNR